MAHRCALVCVLLPKGVQARSVLTLISDPERVAPCIRNTFSRGLVLFTFSLMSKLTSTQLTSTMRSTPELDGSFPSKQLFRLLIREYPNVSKERLHRPSHWIALWNRHAFSFEMSNPQIQGTRGERRQGAMPLAELEKGEDICAVRSLIVNAYCHLFFQ